MKPQIVLDTPVGGARLLLTTADGWANVRRLLPSLDQDVDGAWEGFVVVPDDYSADAAIELWIAANATTGNARLRAGFGSTVTDADSFDGAYTFAAYQTVAVPGVAKQIEVVTFTPGAGPTVVAGELLPVRVERDADDGVNDGLAKPLAIVAALLAYTAA